MLSLDAHLKGLATLVCLSFALLFSLSRGRDAAPRRLATFLFLIAGNQACETARAMLPDAPIADRLALLAGVFASLDPAALMWFALAMSPSRHAGTIMTVVGCISGVFALLFGFVLSPGDLLVGPLLTIYTAVIYAAVAASMTRRMLDEGQVGPATLALFAYSVAAVPVPISASEFLLGYRPDRLFYGTLIVDLATLAITLGIILAPAAGRLREHIPRVMGLFTLCIASWLVFNTSHIARAILHLSGGSDPEPFAVIGRSSAPVRWLVFSSLMSIVLVRLDAFSLSPSQRRRATRALVALAVLSVAGVAFAVAATFLNFAVSPLELGVLALLVILSQGFRQALDYLAWRLYGVPRSGDVAARHDAYRVAASQAVLRGRSPARDSELQRLREELELDSATADAIERVADAGIERPLAAGQIVAGRYRVERLLGRGGSGRVFLAQDETLHRPVVVKEVLASSPPEQEAVLREARLAAGVPHENVLTIHDVLQRSGAVLIVAEHVDGGSVDDLLTRGKVAPAQAAALVEGILDALRALHARGIVHGDIKPSNVLLTSSGLPKIADFGIARMTRGATVAVGSASHVLRGTPGFVAPELRDGAEATPSSDVYAVGILARLLWHDEAPPGIATVIDRALARDPAARWPDAEAFLGALRGTR